jgi:hypothetical protein
MWRKLNFVTRQGGDSQFLLKARLAKVNLVHKQKWKSQLGEIKSQSLIGTTATH